MTTSTSSPAETPTRDRITPPGGNKEGRTPAAPPRQAVLGLRAGWSVGRRAGRSPVGAEGVAVVGVDRVRPGFLRDTGGDQARGAIAQADLAAAAGPWALEHAGVAVERGRLRLRRQRQAVVEQR